MKGEGQRSSIISISWGRGAIVFYKHLYFEVKLVISSLLLNIFLFGLYGLVEKCVLCICWYRGFCHRTGSDLLLFVFISTLIPGCSVERCNKVPRVRVFKVSLFISFEF